ncbi:hypothetical protein GCM10010495_74200 [Kitasatospora herbaricolor]|uniref:hypothetical protein n=1 Tax=Kitasatospora herbaricolor TaxID=68217 RepID=UPI001749C0FD|nr:hypothetical protein [Kitasatospora herbaricolor]MDQ0305472.1 hypothetical protein [Kitasatospora herbaricolor]GGV45748.1 hypothetical protein GCM10010495_74200 [Kitasatospora herbaricolor]
MGRIIPVTGYIKQDGTRVRAHTRLIGGATAAAGGLGGTILAVLLLLLINNGDKSADQPPAPAPRVTMHIGAGS